MTSLSKLKRVKIFEMFQQMKHFRIRITTIRTKKIIEKIVIDTHFQIDRQIWFYESCHRWNFIDNHKFNISNQSSSIQSVDIRRLTVSFFVVVQTFFIRSIQLPSLDIYSTTPDGRQVNNLTLTRVRNATKDHILLFKVKQFDENLDENDASTSFERKSVGPMRVSKHQRSKKRLFRAQRFD